MDKQQLIKTASEIRALDKKVVALEKKFGAAMKKLTSQVSFQEISKPGDGPDKPPVYDAKKHEAVVIAKLKKGGADASQAKKVWAGYKKEFDKKVMPDLMKCEQMAGELATRFAAFRKDCEAHIAKLKAEAKEIDRLTYSVLS